MKSLSHIYIYPIKSLGGISLKKARITDRGLEHDRRWMLVDSNLRFVTRRTIRETAFMDVSVEQDHLMITDRRDAGNPLLVPFLPESNDTLKVKVWDSTTDAQEVSRHCSQWFSEHLGNELKLVYMPDESVRISNPRYTGTIERVGFADGYPFMMIGQSTLDELNSRLAVTIGMDRFRPNFVFTGGQPYEEDHWKTFRIGDAEFRNVKPCARCVIPTVDPLTAIAGKEPILTLSTYRKVENNILFGINAVCDSGEELCTGGEIVISSLKNE